MAAPPPSVFVEFYGLPRRRAGRAALTVTATTIREALKAVAVACPELAGIVDGHRLNPHYLLSRDGTRFISDLNEPLAAGARLLLFGADAGG